MTISLNTNLESLYSIKMYTRGYWANTYEGLSIHYYEGADTSEYLLPYPHVIVMVLRHHITNNRGVALAFKWNLYNENNRCIWMNIMHDEWAGWTLIVDK